MGSLRPGEFSTKLAPLQQTHSLNSPIAKTLIMILFCMQDFDGIVSATYPNNWAEYLVQLIGPDGAAAFLALLWLDSTCATASCFMSAQRVTFAISRDGVLPFSRYFRRLSSNRVPVHAALLVFVLGLAITCAVIGSTVAFSAITATATIVTNVSYLIPIAARHTIGRRDFQPARFNLGRYSGFVGAVSAFYIMLIFVVLTLPQLYPVTAVRTTLRGSKSPIKIMDRTRKLTHLCIANTELCPYLHCNRYHYQPGWLDTPIRSRRQALVRRSQENNRRRFFGWRRAFERKLINIPCQLGRSHKVLSRQQAGPDSVFRSFILKEFLEHKWLAWGTEILGRLFELRVLDVEVDKL